MKDWDQVKRIGRCYEWKEVLWLGLSGCGVAFETDAENVTIQFTGDTSTRGQETEGKARVAVYVDEVRKMDFMMTEKEKTVELAVPQNTEAFHKVEIIKLSECAMSLVGIVSIVCKKEEEIIRPVKEKALRLEFIGDSITCGYGVDLEDPEYHFTTNTEDCTKAYAIKTAKLLDADYSLVSYSGYGIISGFTDDGVKKENQKVPDFYEKCGFSYAKEYVENETGTGPENKDWDFSKYVPDVIVINLGTNDHSYCQDDLERLNEYQEKYIQFLKCIRKHNKEARILCTLGLMDAGKNVEAARRVVEEYSKQTGDQKIYFEELSLQKPEDGMVCDYHPSQKSHGKAAEKIANKIREMIVL